MLSYPFIKRQHLIKDRYCFSLSNYFLPEGRLCFYVYAYSWMVFFVCPIIITCIVTGCEGIGTIASSRMIDSVVGAFLSASWPKESRV